MQANHILALILSRSRLDALNVSFGRLHFRHILMGLGLPLTEYCINPITVSTLACLGLSKPGHYLSGQSRNDPLWLRNALFSLWDQPSHFVSIIINVKGCFRKRPCRHSTELSVSQPQRNRRQRVISFPRVTGCPAWNHHTPHPSFLSGTSQ